jgi:ribonuclease-3
VLGAIYLDAGIRSARRFVQRHLLRPAERVRVDVNGPRDPKSRLLQLAQAHGYGQPDYRLISQEGPEHERIFTVAVVMRRRRIATGSGRSKQLAEKEAAARALAQLQAALQRRT